MPARSAVPARSDGSVLQDLKLHMLRSQRLDAGPGAKRLQRSQVFRSLSRRLDATRLLSSQPRVVASGLPNSSLDV
jgi:hypothetical protein